MRSLVGSYYLGMQGVGVSRMFADQGPGIGYYNNVGSLNASYSLGQDVTSDLGAIMSQAKWGGNPGNTIHNYSFSNNPHNQGGNGATGNEFDYASGQFIGGL